MLTPICSRSSSKQFLSCVVFSTLLLLLQAFPISPEAAPPHHAQFHQTAAVVTYSDYCDGTLYPDLCVSTLSSVRNSRPKSLSDAICATINATRSAVIDVAGNCSRYLARRDRTLDRRQRLALADCLELFFLTHEELNAAQSGVAADAGAHADDIWTVLSAAITNPYTCLDGFAYVGGGGGYRRAIQRKVNHVARLASNSLAMARKIQRPQAPGRKGREAWFPAWMASKEWHKAREAWFPAWMTSKDRKLLQTATGNATKANLVVAKDGSGNFTTIGAALAAAPNTTQTRFVIYVKAGAYFENVQVGSSKTNLMLIGDGIGKTVVKASRNVADGWTTFNSATLAVVGTGFLMRDITVENAAGPSKGQAVALRVNADLSAFYRCSFVGYQDTLYVHSLRQFYRECNVYGTVDFIFGNAAVVLQACNLYARLPLHGQGNVITAQGREDPNQNTGISIHGCKVAAAADLIPMQNQVSTYLGRPWQQYSRTVVMLSNLGSLIQPAGWLPWNGTFALDTLYYGEYMNRGPGADTSRRVNWRGYRVINSTAEASKFTVATFIQGNNWLPSTSVPFTPGLN